MRVGGLLLLLGAFVVGIGSAFAFAYFTLDAKPVAVVDRGPMIKILVAKTPLAVGEEITAEAVVFQDVPVAELPDGALSNFYDAYRRQPAFPISPGCPICEDLLIQKTPDIGQTAKYVPVGTQIVVLEVEQVRLDRHSQDARLPITQVLSTEDSIDIRVVQRQDSQGELIERKNNILRTFAPERAEQKEEIGELILEDIPLYDVRSSGHAVEGKQYQTVSLLLENDQVEKLHQAARDGRLRIALHAELETALVAEQVEVPAEDLEVKVEEDLEPQVQPEPIEEQTPENVQAVSELEPEVEPELDSESKVVHLIGLPNGEEPLSIAELPDQEQAASAELSSPSVVFGLPKTSENTQDIRNDQLVSEKPAVVKAPKTAVVGLMFSPDSMEAGPSHDYSPFGLKTRSLEQETLEPGVPKPLPARQRFQWN